MLLIWKLPSIWLGWRMNNNRSNDYQDLLDHQLMSSTQSKQFNHWFMWVLMVRVLARANLRIMISTYRNNLHKTSTQSMEFDFKASNCKYSKVTQLSRAAAAFSRPPSRIGTLPIKVQDCKHRIFGKNLQRIRAIQTMTMRDMWMKQRANIKWISSLVKYNKYHGLWLMKDQRASPSTESWRILSIKLRGASCLRSKYQTVTSSIVLERSHSKSPLRELTRIIC